MHSLPLHVARRIGTTRTKRFDMVDHIAGAGASTLAGCGTGMLLLEGGFRPGATGGRRVRGLDQGGEQQGQQEQAFMRRSPAPR